MSENSSELPSRRGGKGAKEFGRKLFIVFPTNDGGLDVHRRIMRKIAYKLAISLPDGSLSLSLSR